MMVLCYTMTTIRSQSEANAQGTIDRNFYPDLREHYEIEPALLASLERLGIETVGEPFPGRPGARGAIWHGRINNAGELAVMVAVNPIEEEPVLSTYTKWYAGCAPAAAQPTELDEKALGIYASFAEHPARSREAVIILADILLHGVTITTPELLSQHHSSL